MTFNLSAHLATVNRRVETTDRDGQLAKSVIIATQLPKVIDEVWAAISEPDRLSRWFLPVTGDLREGGSYQLESNAGGTITTCDRPNLLELTWEFGGEVSWLVVRLNQQRDSTLLEIDHIALLEDVHWPAYGPGAAGVGWDGALVGLARHLQEPGLDVHDPEWVNENAAELYGAASDAWGQAAIQAGTPEDEALSQAARTRAFYLAGE